jgi:uncharacterized LabA/DUF88 family protein
VEGKYVFIDGEHLRVSYEHDMHAFYGPDAPPIDYARLRTSLQAEKLFLYDSVDDSPRDGETAEAATARVAPRIAELDRAQASIGCHVRYGSVKKGNRRRGHEQKEVDVLLAVEMLTHAYRGNFRRAVLMTGDLDFKPLVDSLVSFGSNVEVWHARRSGARGLLDAADSRREMTLSEFHSWAEAFAMDALPPIPRPSLVEGRRTYDWQIVRQGRAAGAPCFIANHGASNFTLVVPRYQGAHDLHVQYFDEEKLALFASLVYGDVEWDGGAT